MIKTIKYVFAQFICSDPIILNISLRDNPSPLEALVISLKLTPINLSLLLLVANLVLVILFLILVANQQVLPDVGDFTNH